MQYLHEPLTGIGIGLVLTHGAGGNMHAPLLVKTAEEFARAGFLVLRYNLPFRQRKPFGPPSPAGAAEDRAGLQKAVGELRERVSCVCLGGHSYGGRQASMLTAEEPELVEGLLLLSYPLHPPKKPAQLRTGHFAQIQNPCLFVSGTKDEFGTREEMTAALALIPAKKEFQMIEGAGHDLMKGAFDLHGRVVIPYLQLIKPS